MLLRTIMRIAAAALASLVLSVAMLNVAMAKPQIRIAGMVRQGGNQAPSDAECRSTYGIICYSPQEMRKIYGLDALIKGGFDGTGQTIVIIDSFGSPTIEADLKAFDQGYGLPDPPSFKVIAPLGTVPFDPNDNTQAGWAFETTLDVEWAHAIAPGASIVLLTSPVAETEGVEGLPEFLALEKYALSHHLGKIISQSWGATENTLMDAKGRKLLADFEAFYAQATANRVTLITGSGDDGTGNVGLDGVTPLPFPTVTYPSSSQWNLTIGGTSLYASTSGVYDHETVWNDGDGGGASGGGISQIFCEPLYQALTLGRSVNQKLGGKRGLPDVSYNADPVTGILVYLSFFGADDAGYYQIGGTSEGAPQWAGIVADLSQYAGRPVGFLNPAIYALGGLGQFHRYGRDVTTGNNGYNGVPGYNATAGWDLATGWGTPNLVNVLRQEFDLAGH